ncbi:MAG: 2-oxo acid dehydrogenase subunit E2 [Eubacteriaceae bacterium]
MATKIYMPKAGMDMQEGKIIRWLVEVGDLVAEGDGLLEIETDKVTMEVEAEIDGELLCKYYGDGETVPVVTVIGYLGEHGESIPEENNETVLEKQEKKATIKKEEKEKPHRKENNKEAYVPGSPYAKLIAKENNINLSEVLGTGPYGEVKARDVENALGTLSAPKNTKMSPLAKRIVDENELNITNVQGSGYNGKIMKKDLFNEGRGFVSYEELEVWEEKRVPLSGMRKVVGKRMLQSHTEIPSVTNHVKCDVTALVEARKKLNENSEQRISMNDFILKAVAKTLRNNPQILVNLEGSEIVYRNQVNLGMAVAVEDGLLVPVIKNADKLSLYDISKEARALARKARDNQLRPDEYQGNTFTISNLGMYDVEMFTPIINQPDSGILGINAIQEELALENGVVVVKKVMRTSFTYDHRLLDGVSAAKFQLAVKKLLENPIEIVL